MFNGGNMDNIDLMIKRRALFLETIIGIDNGIMDDAEGFGMLLNGFVQSYMDEYYDLFNLLYVFEKNDEGKLQIYEEDEWAIPLYKYLSYFNANDSKNIIKLYNEIGSETVDKISQLVELFQEYLSILFDNRVIKIKS